MPAMKPNMLTLNFRIRNTARFVTQPAGPRPGRDCTNTHINEHTSRLTLHHSFNCNMFARNIRPLQPLAHTPFVLLTTKFRGLTVSPILQKAAAKTTPEQAAKKKLRASLAKEKAKLAELKSKHKAHLAKQKALTAARKQEEKNKKKEKEALKKFRKISPFNAYVKENLGPGSPLVDVSRAYQNLTESEKEHWARKADEHNAQQAQQYPDPPKRPANGYAVFVRENWTYDGREFSEIASELGSRWKLLPAEEKASYAPSAEVVQKYKAAFEAWKKDRLSKIQD